MKVDKFKLFESPNGSRRDITVVNFLAARTIDRKYGTGIGYKGDLYNIYLKKNYKKAKIIDFKELTSFMNYKCDFIDGKCRDQRNKTSRWEKSPQCCCVDCRLHIGYLRFIPSSRIGYYASIFDSKTGFWKEGAGCQIENRFERSRTCLSYSCRENPQFRKSIVRLSNIINCLENELISLQIKEDIINGGVTC